MADWTARITTTVGLKVEAALYNALGSLYPDYEILTEELKAEGVPGIRKRELFGEGMQMPVPLRLVLPIPSGESIDYYDIRLGQMRGRIVQVTLKDGPGGSTLVQWNRKECHLDEARIMERSGPLIGYGALSGSTRTVVANVTLLWVGE